MVVTRPRHHAIAPTNKWHLREVACRPVTISAPLLYRPDGPAISHAALAPGATSTRTAPPTTKDRGDGRPLGFGALVPVAVCNKCTRRCGLHQSVHQEPPSTNPASRSRLPAPSSPANEPRHGARPAVGLYDLRSGCTTCGRVARSEARERLR